MYRPGYHLAICDICGFRAYGSELRRTHTGLMVHNRCFDPQHPQELIRPTRDKITVADPRPEGPDVYLSPGDVTPESL